FRDACRPRGVGSGVLPCASRESRLQPSRHSHAQGAGERVYSVEKGKTIMAQDERSQCTVDELLARIEILEDRLSRKRGGLRLPRVKRVPVAIAGATIAVLASGAAFAAMPHATNVIHACVGTRGALRVATVCRSGEKVLTWNKQGPAGPR